MKKVFLFTLSFLLVTVTWAQEVKPSSVESVPEKDTQFENTVTINEFNSIVSTLRGIYNFFNDGQVQLGINELQPATSLTLDVGGKIGATEYCDANGEHCIDPATWDARPQLEVQPAGATCQVRYRVQDQKYETDWHETGSNNDPVGPIARFNSGLKHNCSGEGCGITMGLRCKPNLAVTDTARCRLRYRLNHPGAGGVSPWITTELTGGDDWQDGEWSTAISPNGGWGDGLNVQMGIECQDETIRCQVGQRLHNEIETTPWQLSNMTDGAGWKDSEPSQLSATTARACDQRTGCGLQVQTRCVGRASTVKTPIYSCPKTRDGRCPSQCGGQLSLEDKCSYQKLSPDDTCQVLLTEKCEKVGNLVQ